MKNTSKAGRAYLIARAYEASPVIAKGAREAYALLVRYLYARMRDIKRDGWTLVMTYDGAAPDLAESRRTKVLPVHNANHGHPILTDTENFMFRAVHDVYGHVEAPFGFAGEVAACKAQIDDFNDWLVNTCSPPAPYGRHRLVRCALFSEIVGQAAYFEVHGEFPPQKAALLWSVFNA